MQLVEGLREAFALMGKAVNDLPDSIDRWSMKRHQPQPMNEDTPWCFTCREAWPCDEFVKADERITSRGASTQRER